MSLVEQYRGLARYNTWMNDVMVFLWEQRDRQVTP
jgi:hypothetical protein